ncbi:MAG: hypothetical protein IJ613_01280 [Muribaculaceae bacterium]|nr:hypothetical protein [Muribaculaceae bacterium]
MSQSSNNNSQWMDVVADKARHAQQPVDERLWQRIETQLPSTHPRRPAWLWWSAAAAAAILVLAIITRPAKTDKVGGEVTAEMIPVTTASPITQAANVTAPLPSQGARAQSPLTSQGRGRGGVETHTGGGVETATPPGGTHVTTPLASVSEKEQTETTLATANPPSTTQQQGDPLYSIHNYQPAENDSQFSIGNSQFKGDDAQFSISLYGSGNLLAQNSNHAVQRPVLMAMGNGRFMEAQASTRYHYKHRIPLNVGIMLGKSLPHNLTVGIGVNYARYSSEVSADLERFDQTVQFIGIPVALQWHFWHYRRLSAYVGAEAMAERCIAVDRGDEQVDVPRRIQWSVHGMAGLQLAITDHLGLFVEPKVSHYATRFTLPTARNEHPLTFNLKMGANINF